MTNCAPQLSHIQKYFELRHLMVRDSSSMVLTLREPKYLTLLDRQLDLCPICGTRFGDFP